MKPTVGQRRILVTGGAGFIGSALVRLLLKDQCRVVVLDALTYAGSESNLKEVEKDPNFCFVKGDINDKKLCTRLLEEHQVNTVVNMAAESHVDRSIDDAQNFVRTNVQGTYQLLEASRRYQKEAPHCAGGEQQFLFLQVSTDEVFGSLGPDGFFNEDSPYRPRSPYSASKAAADHLVEAWGHTYRLPFIITHCSNNYGPRQFPEKLIPLMVERALRGEELPVYGTGKNVRDWIHVEDHALGLYLAIQRGNPGERYCFGGQNERANIDVVHQICRILAEIAPRRVPYEKQIRYVEDRAGHDWRYAIDDAKARAELGFERRHTNFEESLKDTVIWYYERFLEKARA